MNYDNELSGALFRNKKKKLEKQPDYYGTCEIQGKTYRVSAWVNKSNKGEQYLKMKYQQEEQEQQSVPTSAVETLYGEDDDLPF